MAGVRGAEEPSGDHVLIRLHGPDGSVTNARDPHSARHSRGRPLCGGLPLLFPHQPADDQVSVGVAARVSGRRWLC